MQHKNPRILWRSYKEHNRAIGMRKLKLFNIMPLAVIMLITICSVSSMAAKVEITDIGVAYFNKGDLENDR